MQIFHIFMCVYVQVCFQVNIRTLQKFNFQYKNHVMSEMQRVNVKPVMAALVIQIYHDKFTSNEDNLAPPGMPVLYD